MPSPICYPNIRSDTTQLAGEFQPCCMATYTLLQMAPQTGIEPIKIPPWEGGDYNQFVHWGIKWRRTYGLLPLMLTLVRTSCTNEFSLWHKWHGPLELHQLLQTSPSTRLSRELFLGTPNAARTRDPHIMVLSLGFEPKSAKSCFT